MLSERGWSTKATVGIDDFRRRIHALSARPNESSRLCVPQKRHSKHVLMMMMMMMMMTHGVYRTHDGH